MSVSDNLKEMECEDKSKQTNNNSEIDVKPICDVDSITNNDGSNICKENQHMNEKDTSVTYVEQTSHSDIKVEKLDISELHESDCNKKENPPNEDVKELSCIDLKNQDGKDYTLHNQEAKADEYKHNETVEKSREYDTSGIGLVGDSPNNMNEEESQSVGDTDKTTSPVTLDSTDSVSDSLLGDVVDISGGGGLTKRIIRKGLGDKTRPTIGVTVTVKYKAWNKGGKLFADEKETFILGQGDVVEALDYSLTSAETGELFELNSNACYAYGAHGLLPDVNSGDSVKYHVELLSVDGRPDYDTYSYDQRITAAEKKRERGNFLYRREEFAKACISYSQAIAIIQTEPDFKSTSTDVSKRDLFDLFIKLSNNLAASLLKLQKYDGAIATCDDVLVYDADNVKALFRRGKCLRMTGSLDEALVTLKKAFELDNLNRLIEKEIQACMTSIRSRDKPDQCKQTFSKYTMYAIALVVMGVSVFLATVAFSKSK